MSYSSKLTLPLCYEMFIEIYLHVYFCYQVYILQPVIFGDKDQGITTSGILWNMVCSEISRSFVYHKAKNNSESCYFITIQISKQYVVSNRGGSPVSSQEADRIAQPVKKKNKRIISTKHKVISTKSSVNVF